MLEIRDKISVFLSFYVFFLLCSFFCFMLSCVRLSHSIKEPAAATAVIMHKICHKSVKVKRSV